MKFETMTYRLIDEAGFRNSAWFTSPNKNELADLIVSNFGEMTVTNINELGSVLRIRLGDRLINCYIYAQCREYFSPVYPLGVDAALSIPGPSPLKSEIDSIIQFPKPKSKQVLNVFDGIQYRSTSKQISICA